MTFVRTTTLAACVAALGLALLGGRASEPTRMGGIHPTSLPIVDTDLAVLSTGNAQPFDVRGAHRKATGRDVRVAVLDGGFDLQHPAVRRAWIGTGYDAVDQDRNAHDIGNGKDDDGDGVIDEGIGHGTFVAGQILWAAPDAHILPVRVRDDEGLGSDAALLRGLRMAEQIGVDVVNLSVDCAASKPQRLFEALARLERRGVTIVVSAGNDGRDRLSTLAGCPSAIAVAAVDGEGRLASFSNHVTARHVGLLAAPGVDLVGPFTRGRHARWSGTSFAAGLVSGWAAWLREARPDLKGRAAGLHLCDCCEPVSGADHERLPFGRLTLEKVMD